MADTFKHRHYANLAKGDTWIKYFKPDLEKIKQDISLSDADVESGFKAIQRDIKRSQTNKIINQIIRLIERAEDKIGRR